MSEPMEEVPGETLRSLRYLRNLTMREASEGVICLTSLCDLENGHNRNPRVETLRKLADRYRVSTERIYLALVRTCNRRCELNKNPSFTPGQNKRRRRSLGTTEMAVPLDAASVSPETGEPDILPDEEPASPAPSSPVPAQGGPAAAISVDPEGGRP